MAPQWQLERIEVSVTAMLSRVVQAGVCLAEFSLIEVQSFSER